MKQRKTFNLFAVTVISLSFAFAYNTMAFGEDAFSDGLEQDHPCTENASRKMQEQIYLDAAEPGQLRTLVASILCETSIPDDRVETTYRHFSPFISHTIEQIGELPSTTKIPRSKDLAAEMILASKVEHASLIILGRNMTKLNYSSDICSRQITTELSRGSWLITNYVSSCD